MNSDVIVTVTIVTVTCCSCGIPFGMPDYLDRRLRDSHEMFYCPNGHPQYYTGETEAQRLKRELEHEERNRKWVEQQLTWERTDHTETKNRLRATKAAHTRTKNRIKNGVCPHCNRYFENLHKHMQSKHGGIDE